MLALCPFRSLLLIAIVSIGAVAAACTSSATPTSPSISPVTTGTPAIGPTGIAVAGMVYDTGYRGLAGAVVEVLDGPSAGTTAIADGTGLFAIRGDFDENTHFRATKAGHADGVAKMGPICAGCHPNFWMYFYLAVPDAPAALTGDFTLTITADATCAGLPEHARQRTYSVHIAPAASQPTAQITSFTGTIAGGQVTGRTYDGIWFALAGNYIEFWSGDLHGDPGLSERTDENSYYSVGAWGHTTLGSDGTATIASTFEGQVRHCVLPPGAPLLDTNGRFTCGIERALTSTVCQSTQHQLLLTRR
jgi:hypothetical protein